MNKYIGIAAIVAMVIATGYILYSTQNKNTLNTAPQVAVTNETNVGVPTEEVKPVVANKPVVPNTVPTVANDNGIEYKNTELGFSLLYPKSYGNVLENKFLGQVEASGSIVSAPDSLDYTSYNYNIGDGKFHFKVDGKNYVQYKHGLFFQTLLSGCKLKVDSKITTDSPTECIEKINANGTRYYYLDLTMYDMGPATIIFMVPLSNGAVLGFSQANLPAEMAVFLKIIDSVKLLN